MLLPHSLLHTLFPKCSSSGLSLSASKSTGLGSNCGPQAVTRNPEPQTHHPQEVEPYAKPIAPRLSTSNLGASILFVGVSFSLPPRPQDVDTYVFTHVYTYGYIHIYIYIYINMCLCALVCLSRSSYQLFILTSCTS